MFFHDYNNRKAGIYKMPDISVLIIDDEPSILKAVSMTLKQEHIAVTCADNGTLALDILKMCIRDRSGPGFVTTFPFTSIIPSVGFWKPATIVSVVVLPQPDGPNRHTNCPSSISKETSFNTWLSDSPFLLPLKFFDIPCTEIDIFFDSFSSFLLPMVKILSVSLRPILYLPLIFQPGKTGHSIFQLLYYSFL